MTASGRLREIGKDINWPSDQPTTYNRPLAGAIDLAKAFDEILLVVEAAEGADDALTDLYVEADTPEHAALRAALAALEDALSDG